MVAQITVSSREVRENNPHQNARTTAYSREIMVGPVMKGKSAIPVAADLAVSRRAARYRAGGEGPLQNRSFSPSPQPAPAGRGIGGHHRGPAPAGQELKRAAGAMAEPLPQPSAPHRS